jgi:hypothetical protein
LSGVEGEINRLVRDALGYIPFAKRQDYTDQLETLVSELSEHEDTFTPSITEGHIYLSHNGNSTRISNLVATEREISNNRTTETRIMRIIKGLGYLKDTLPGFTAQQGACPVSEGFSIFSNREATQMPVVITHLPPAPDITRA